MDIDFHLCTSLRVRRFLGGGLGRVQPSSSEASARKFERREKYRAFSHLKFMIIINCKRCLNS